MSRAATYAAAIVEITTARLQSVALDDPALISMRFTVHFRAGGGGPRSVVTQAEVQDSLSELGRIAVEYVDACGPASPAQRQRGRG